MTRKIETHHYASRLNEDFLQCAVYDSDQSNARLIGNSLCFLLHHRNTLLCHLFSSSSIFLCATGKDHGALYKHESVCLSVASSMTNLSVQSKLSIVIHRKLTNLIVKKGPHIRRL